MCVCVCVCVLRNINKNVLRLKCSAHSNIPDYHAGIFAHIAYSTGIKIK